YLCRHTHISFKASVPFMTSDQFSVQPFVIPLPDLIASVAPLPLASTHRISLSGRGLKTAVSVSSSKSRSGPGSTCNWTRSPHSLHHIPSDTVRVLPLCTANIPLSPLPSRRLASG